MTQVGIGGRRPSLGLILPATMQEELPGYTGSTPGSTATDAGALAELCRRAEATGADSLWAVDHIFWPHPINECLTTLVVAAGATSRPTLGSCVLQLPLRHPAAVAKQASALALLSGGRFVLGLGVGSHEAEYRLADVDFHRRGHLMDEGITTLRQAWDSADDTASSYHQSPVSPRVPVWIGGASAAARRRAGRVGDGWVPLFLTAERYGRDLAELRRKTAEAGRRPEDIAAAVVVFVRVGDEATAPRDGAHWLSDLYGVPPKAFERHLVAGPPEHCAAALARFAHVGADHVVVMVAGTGAVEQFDQVRAAFVAQTSGLLAGVPG